MTPRNRDLCGIPLRNPVLAASGTFAYGVEFAELVDLNAARRASWSRASPASPSKAIRRRACMKPKPGMINSVGLQNIGVRAFAREKLPALAHLRTAVFANIFGL